MITKNSRYMLTSIISVVDPVTGMLARPEFIDIRPRITGRAPDDKIMAATTNTRWGNVGLARLGDANAWWAVADLSNVIDPFTELVTGKELVIPSVQRYLFDILSPEQTST